MWVLVVVAVTLALAGAALGLRSTAEGNALGPERSPRLQMERGRGVPAWTVTRVDRRLRAYATAIDADFGVVPRATIHVVLYADHATFALAMHRLEGIEAEGGGDNMSNIVHGTLLLGPATPVRSHDLAHVYTEWLLDRLTHNASDRQPDPAWLYDGLAEYEASRHGPRLPCRLQGAYPLALSSLATPSQWWSVRAGMFQGMEYCEAQSAAASLVHHIGWSRLVERLKHSQSWQQFARSVGWVGVNPTR